LIEGNILILVLIQNVPNVSACSQAMVCKGSEYTFQQATKMTGLHLAAYFGLERTTSKLLERNAVVDSQDEDGRTRLSWAARDGDNVVVELLLENKTEMESSNSEYTQTLPSGR
jgi:ankyrin repeat protein